MARDSSATTSITEDSHRFPYCIVWTPIPLITWILPFVGHMGICTSRGVIRDFAGSHYVSEDDMACKFLQIHNQTPYYLVGWPTSVLQLSPANVNGGSQAWDQAIHEASEEYKGHTVRSLDLVSLKVLILFSTICSAITVTPIRHSL